MTKLNLLVLSLLFVPLASMADCPLGAKEDHLTIQRVMRNFGRFVMVADSVALNGVNPIEKPAIKDADISEAITKLGFAIDCSSEVLKNPTGDLLPSKLNLMTDEKEKAEIADDFVTFMGDFHDGLVEYQDMFKKLLAQPATDRNFDEVNNKRQELDDLVERAHKKL